jgi:hypothetical protein
MFHPFFQPKKILRTPFPHPSKQKKRCNVKQMRIFAGRERKLVREGEIWVDRERQREYKSAPVSRFPKQKV